MSRLCDRDGCAEPADWQVGLDYYPHDRYPQVPLLAHFNLFVCDAHRAGIGVQDILTPDGELQFAAAIVARGVAPPDFEKTRLHWYERERWLIPNL